MDMLGVPSMIAAVASVPNVTLTQGTAGARVRMPVMAYGTAELKGSAATSAVALAVAAGMRHVHTAFDYYNLAEVGAALANEPRTSVFVTSMTSPCVHAAPPSRNVTDPEACFNLTLFEAQHAISQLKVGYLDLLLLHGPSERFGHTGPCNPLACLLNAAQWRAYDTLLSSGAVRAIGVSNFCVSCMECLAASGNNMARPAVNQIQMHVGMGADPGGLLSYCSSRQIVVQAYEPLAGGEIVTDALCKSVGAAHNRSAAQVGLRWVLQRAPSLAVRAGSEAHLLEDLDAWSWALSGEDVARLDAATQPKGEAGGRCSWGCTE